MINQDVYQQYVWNKKVKHSTRKSEHFEQPTLNALNTRMKLSLTNYPLYIQWFSAVRHTQRILNV